MLNAFLFVVLMIGALYFADVILILMLKGEEAFIGYWAPVYTRLPGGSTYWLLVKNGELPDSESSIKKSQK